MTVPFVSFAQNYEDVMLWRALKHVEAGFYVDVGAYSPRVDSVTEAFYERGWHGLNIEPNPDFHRQFVAERPRDVNLQVAVGDRPGELTLYVLSNAGLSTLDAEQAQRHTRDGLTISPQTVQVATLGAVWRDHIPRDQAVHFLKVDVEGFERQVLAGNDWTANRPWIVVVEATQPMSQAPSHGDWEPILTGAGYRFAYGDGLNRFYVADEHAGLIPAFADPPNFFDGFIRASEVEITQRAERAEARLATAEQELGLIRASRSWRLATALRGAVARLRKIWDR